MNVTLPPRDYDEEDEVDLNALRARLKQADAEIDRGQGLEFNEHSTRDLAADIRARGMRKLAESQKPGAS